MKDMTKRINIGLIGAGRIMPAHLHGYKEMMEKGIDDIRITAICEKRPGEAERFRKRGEGPPPREPIGPPGDPLAVPHIYVDDFQKDVDVELYTDYKEMLRKADIDAVDVYVPVFTHHPLVLDSLEAGKHVLVEKPLAVTVKAGRKMVEAAERAGLVLGVAEVIRYGFGGTRETKWVMDQGYIGDVQMVIQGGIGGYWSPDKIAAETAWRHRKVEAGAGMTLDMGVHLFNGLRYLCGEVRDVRSIVKTFERIRVTRDKAGKVIDQVRCEVDDTFFTLINFESGAVGHVFFSWAGHGEPTDIPGGRVIYGSKGCIKGDNVILDDGTKAGVKDLFDKKASEEVKERFFPRGLTNPFALETYEFLRAIQEGREMETSGRDGLRDMAASYAMIESSLLNRAVGIEEVESGKLDNYEKEINEYYRL